MPGAKRPSQRPARRRTLLSPAISTRWSDVMQSRSAGRQRSPGQGDRSAGRAMARVTDACGIQFRKLNTSKVGGAATRASATRRATASPCARARVAGRLHLKQHEVERLIVEDGAIAGVETSIGLSFRARAVVITTGTFCAGAFTSVTRSMTAARGRSAGRGLSASLLSLGLRWRVSRPASCRLDGAPSMGGPRHAAGRSAAAALRRRRTGAAAAPVPCHVTFTGERTHAIIRANLHRRPCMGSSARSPESARATVVDRRQSVRFADKPPTRSSSSPRARHSRVYPTASRPACRRRAARAGAIDPGSSTRR